ncbi:MAG: DUF3795 domain-containing protein [Oribacterium sp.]|nr:DUF3795 domain-containing protein [Oribacterium sp.]
MNDYIAYCGLNCETCEAHIATVNNDDELRKKVAKEWSEMNHAEITPEMINCAGCRKDGVKFPYCEFMCAIRQCAIGKHHTTCGDCSDKNSCEKLQPIISNNEEARSNLS